MKRISCFMVVLFTVCAGMTSCQKDSGESTEATKVTRNQPSGNLQAPASMEIFCEGGDDEYPEPMIYGVVKNTSNEKIEGACITLLSDSAVIASTGTDADGHYFFNTASNGTYLIRVIADGYFVKYAPAIVANQVPDEVIITIAPN